MLELAATAIPSSNDDPEEDDEHVTSVITGMEKFLWQELIALALL